VDGFGIAADLLEVAEPGEVELLLLVEFLPEELLAKLFKLETKGREPEVSIELILPDRLVA
jgi:hypothetical protein